MANEHESVFNNSFLYTTSLTVKIFFHMNSQNTKGIKPRKSKKTMKKIVSFISGKKYNFK